MPVKRNHRRAASMTASARNCPRQLPSLALDRATRLLPAFGSCYYLSTERVNVSQALRIFCRTLSSRFTGIRSTCHSPSTVRSSAPCARSKNGCRPPEYAIFIMLYHTHTRHRRDMVKVKRGKCSPYSTAERRVPELILVIGSQPAGDVSHKPGGRLPLLSTRPAVNLATLKRAATSFTVW